MDTNHYLDIFKNTANRLDKKRFAKKQVEIIAGTYKDSVVLKLFKKAWTNELHEPVLSGPRIFFSIWISEADIKEEKLLYNIHALQLRQLNAYNLTSRKFADDFRMLFKKFEPRWPNVRTDFGPLTLMEGWVKAGEASYPSAIRELCSQFLAIDDLIDGLLDDCRRVQPKSRK